MGACLSLECEKCKLPHDSHLLYCQTITHQRAHCSFHNINKQGMCIHCGQYSPTNAGCYHKFTYHTPFV